MFVPSHVNILGIEVLDTLVKEMTILFSFFSTPLHTQISRHSIYIKLKHYDRIRGPKHRPNSLFLKKLYPNGKPYLI